MALLMLAQQRKIPALVFGEQKLIFAFISLIVYISHNYNSNTPVVFNDGLHYYLPEQVS